MSNYFDNQSNWSWNVNDGKAEVVTDHGTHTHTLDVTDVPIGDMADNTGKVMGDAHREASHDFKDETTLDNTDTVAETEAAVNAEPTADVGGNSIDNSDGPDGGDGLDGGDGPDGGDGCDGGMDP